MSTDNRHRPGIVFKCGKCGSRALPIVHPETKDVRQNQWGGERDAWRRVRAHLVECNGCGHKWYSVHRLVRRLVLEREAS